MNSFEHFIVEEEGLELEDLGKFIDFQSFKEWFYYRFEERIYEFGLNSQKDFNNLEEYCKTCIHKEIELLTQDIIALMPDEVEENVNLNIDLIRMEKFISYMVLNIVYSPVTKSESGEDDLSALALRYYYFLNFEEVSEDDARKQSYEYNWKGSDIEQECMSIFGGYKELYMRFKDLMIEAFELTTGNFDNEK